MSILVRSVPSRVERLARLLAAHAYLTPGRPSASHLGWRKLDRPPSCRVRSWPGPLRRRFSLVPVVGVPVAQARAVTCQGQTATVVGPTETDGMSTIGTEGDDVIVAPIGTSGERAGARGERHDLPRGPGEHPGPRRDRRHGAGGPGRRRGLQRDDTVSSARCRSNWARVRTPLSGTDLPGGGVRRRRGVDGGHRHRRRRRPDRHARRQRPHRAPGCPAYPTTT